MPGACAIAAQTSRAFGMSCSSSFVKLVPTVVFLTSTVGESPVIVTVSCSDDNCNWASTLSVWFRPNRISSRLSVWNPVSSNVTVYSPGGSAGYRYVPSPPVTVACA